MFQYAAILVCVLNLLLWLAVRRRLVVAFPKHRRWLTVVSALAFLLLLHPALIMAFGGWGGTRFLQPYLPQWVLLTVVGAQFAAFAYMLMLAAKAAPGLALKVLRMVRRKASPGGTQPERALASDERRRFLARASLVLPMAAIAIGAGGVLGARQAPVVQRIRIAVRRDMTNLHGVTLAQVSDVHVGSYMDAERLDEIRDALNSLKADYHIITGDLLDNHVNQMELSAKFVRELQPVRGQKFLCMGNHEYIAARTADVKTIIGGLEEAGGQVLLDEARQIGVGSDHIWMSGIDYPRGPRGNVPASRSTRESMDLMTGQMRDDGAPRIVLSHHPRTFVEAREFPLDLMLAGHTHGGQIKLGRVGDYALTPILAVDFYHNGFYEWQGRKLYVNAGAGGWLPVRYNCPPEITLVEFVPA